MARTAGREWPQEEEAAARGATAAARSRPAATTAVRPARRLPRARTAAAAADMVMKIRRRSSRSFERDSPDTLSRSPSLGGVRGLSTGCWPNPRLSAPAAKTKQSVTAAVEQIEEEVMMMMKITCAR
jgi:hypothetical protein